MQVVFCQDSSINRESRPLRIKQSLVVPQSNKAKSYQFTWVMDSEIQRLDEGLGKFLVDLSSFRTKPETTTVVFETVIIVVCLID